MNINITLFVQMINVVIAYGVLRWLFLKPAYTVVTQDMQAVQTLHDHIQERKDRLALAKAAFKEQWFMYRQRLIALIPHTTKEEDTLEALAPKSVVLDAKQLKQIEQDTLAIIMKKAQE